MQTDFVVFAMNVASIVAAAHPLRTMLNADSVVFAMIASIVAAANPPRTMLSADSIVFAQIITSIMAAANLLRTMLNADSVVFSLIVTSIVAAHLRNPLQSPRTHSYHQPPVYRLQHHFAEISMPKICIRTNNMRYVHSIWSSISVSKSGQTLLI